MSDLLTLVLNRNYMPLSLWPLSVIDAKDAVTRMWTKKVTVVYYYDIPIKTQTRTDLYWPSVIVTNSRREEKDIRVKPKLLLLRDRYRCIFCGDPLTSATMTKEHLIPRSRGGKDVWENLGAACRKCNLDKGNKMPDGEWKPIMVPHKPTFGELLAVRKQFPIVVHDERWAQFLPGWTGKIIVRPPRGEKSESVWDGGSTL